MHLRTTFSPDWKTSPWPYFILALGWSWLFWIPVMLTGMDISVTPGLVLFIIGILGPGVSGVLRNGDSDIWTVFHFMMNFTLEFLRLPGDLKIYQFVWLTIIAIVVTIVYEPATPTGKVRRRLVGLEQESA